MISNKERYLACRAIYEKLESATDAERVELLKQFQMHVLFFKQQNLDTDAIERLLKEVEHDILDPKALLNSINQYVSTYEEKVNQFDNGHFRGSKNLLGSLFGFEDLVNLRNTIEWYIKRARRSGISLTSVNARLEKADNALKGNTVERTFSLYQRMRMKWKGVNPKKDQRWWFYRKEKS